MDSTRIKIGQVLYGQSAGSDDIALVKVESVGVGGINYNDTDNTFQYSFDELTGIPVSASVLTSSGFTLSNGVYVNDTINFIKVKLIGAQWFWYFSFFFFKLTIYSAKFRIYSFYFTIVCIYAKRIFR